MGVMLPQVTSLVAVALIFSQLFATTTASSTTCSARFGIHHIYWEAGRFSSWIALSMMVIWRWTGYNALIYLAAMQAIPEDLYEAAAIDGARPLPAVLPRHDPDAAADDHLHRDHLHDRRAAALHRAVPVPAAPRAAPPAARTGSTRRSSCTSTRRSFGRRSSSSATPPRSPGASSC